MSFQYQGKNFLLTYPHTDIALPTLVDHCKQNFPPTTYGIVCVEEHRDQLSKHHHIILAFTERLRTRREDYFNIRGRHPNIQSIRNLARAIEYVKKDGDFIEWGNNPVKPDCDLKDAITTSTSRGEAFEKIKCFKHRDILLFGDRIWNNLLHYFPEIPEEYVPEFTEFRNIPGQLSEWARGNIGINERPISLCLCGPSRMGKTEWARSLGRHSYFAEMFNLDDFKCDGEYAIFDDFKLESIITYKGWFGGQKEFTVTDKYRHKKTIKWGKPSIFLCNPDRKPHFVDSISQSWWDSNVLTVFINTTLF